jgi:hypothetical protein
LSEEQILAWAEAHRRRVGRWPTASSGLVDEAPGETWSEVARALRFGVRGLKGFSSLARLLARGGALEPKPTRPDLAIDEILRWADAFHAVHGAWPTAHSGPIPETREDTWFQVDRALHHGSRGLPGGSSLRRLLARRRGVRIRHPRPPLTEEQVLDWADAHYARTGRWPKARSGRIPEAPRETWHSVDDALSSGTRGLPGGSSLRRLLVERRGPTDPVVPPRLTISQVLSWADAHHARHGNLPKLKSGVIPEAPDLTWKSISRALRRGEDGLPGGTTLRALMAEHHRTRYRPARPSLTEEQILAWADAHHARTGRWPKARSGPVVEAPGENWMRVHKALKQGRRGLPGDSSLARLLHQRRGTRYCNARNRPPLTIPQVLSWADAHHARTGRWPTVDSGPIPEAPDENWRAVNTTLYLGGRGLPGGSSLSRLFARERGAQDPRRRPPLTIPQILAWVDAHHARTGRWPTADSGPIPEAPGETWRLVDRRLYSGWCGLPGGSSLSKLVARERGAVRGVSLPPIDR